MKRTLKNWMVALLFVMTAGGSLVTVATPQVTAAACNDRLLTFPAWYKGLTEGADCHIKAPASSKGGVSKFVWTIVLNVVEFMLQLVGYISVAFVIVGGYKYMISAGSPDGMVRARKTIMNALIGLVLSIFSVAIVNVIAGAL